MGIEPDDDPAQVEYGKTKKRRQETEKASSVRGCKGTRIMALIASAPGNPREAVKMPEIQVAYDRSKPRVDKLTLDFVLEEAPDRRCPWPALISSHPKPRQGAAVKAVP